MALLSAQGKYFRKGLAAFQVQNWDRSTQKTEEQLSTICLNSHNPLKLQWSGDGAESNHLTSVLFIRVGKCVRLRYDVHPQRGH